MPYNNLLLYDAKSYGYDNTYDIPTFNNVYEFTYN